MDLGSDAIHDEVIADSEEERDLSVLVTPQVRTNAVSSISDFTTIAHAAHSDEIEPNSIADRAKTRQRTQGTKKKPVALDDFIELTSEEDVETTKPVKPNPKPKAKMADNSSHSATANPHLETIPLRSRPRPRPKPIVKRRQPTLASDPLPPHQYPFARDGFDYDKLPGAGPSTPPPGREQPDLPIATSPAFAGAMNNGMPSQLPPSDPPNSIMTTAVVEKTLRLEDGPLPPIEILQDVDPGRDGDKSLSSPSSLFSDAGYGSRAKSKKRRRHAQLNVPDDEHEVDQLMPSSTDRRETASHVALPVLDAYTHGPEPPPTFFAGSSSSVRHDEERNLNASPKPQVEVVDLTELPPTMDCVKASKLKKRKASTETDPNMGLFGDDGDSDFNPSGKKTTKKAKGRGKDKGKELTKESKLQEKKETTRRKKEQMSAVILKSRAKATKAKAKDNPVEVFKSRETIDSDEDVDPLLLVGDKRGEGTSSTDQTSSPKTSELNQGRLSPFGGKSSRSKMDEQNSSASASAGSKGKASSNSKDKKRKSIVESDQDNDCIVVKRRKPASVVILSDQEVEQVRIDKKKNVARSGEAQKTPSRLGTPNVSDDDVEIAANATTAVGQYGTTAARSEKVSQRASALKVGQENIYHISAPPSIEPLGSRAASIHPGTSTPLYARYEVAPRRSSLPMSELIRRASSKPASPFPPPTSFTPSHKGQSKGKNPNDATCPASSTPLSYSPYLKMSRRALSRIAPLHLNRKTPPPPPPPPPPKKKTKKEREMEERWEEELVESVGGIEVWASMGDSERKDMRRVKREMELAGYDD